MSNCKLLSTRVRTVKVDLSVRQAASWVRQNDLGLVQRRCRSDVKLPCRTSAPDPDIRAIIVDLAVRKARSKPSREIEVGECADLRIALGER